MKAIKVEGLCHEERLRLAASNGVIFVVFIAMIASWILIYKSTHKVKERNVTQTAIAQALEESGTAMIVLDEEANVLYWDDNAVKLFGYTKAEILNKSIDMVVPYGKQHGEIMGKYLSGNDTSMKIIMCEGQKKDGEIIPLSLRVQPKFKDRQVLVFADTITDKTYTER